MKGLLYPVMGLVVVAAIVWAVILIVREVRSGVRRRREDNDDALLASARWSAFQRPELGQWALGVECVAELSSGPARRFPDEEVEHFPYSTDEFTLELRMADKKDLASRMNIAQLR